MVKCYIALAESEDGFKGKGKVFLDKDNCFNYIEHTEGYSTILVGEILEEVLPVHNLVARIKYRDGVSDELDEEIYSELQKFIDKYGHHIESIQISEIK